MVSTLQKKVEDVTKVIFPEYPELSLNWNLEISHLLKRSDYQPTESIKAFFFIIDRLVKEYHLVFEQFEQWASDYKDEIRNFVLPYLQQHKDTIGTYSLKSDSKEVVNQLLNQSFVESGTALLIHRLRETISQNKFDLSSEIPTARITERVLEATAQLRAKETQLGRLKSNEAFEQWQNLTSQAISAMDDLTADIFDIVSILWMEQATHKDQMIHFHTDDALNLRKIRGRSQEQDGYQTSYRKKERDDIMRRLAALTTIWIRVERGSLKFINEDQESFEEIGQVQFNPLFVVDSVTVAYKGDTPIGIYECSIRPGELLSNFLYGSKKSSGLLALKTLEYHPVRQKYHKRLSRYLSWQWRIRQKSADYLRAYNIGGEKGLLNVMDMDVNPRYGSRVKEQFEEILDTLHNDGIIREWRYKEESIEEDIEKTRDWFSNIWLKASVQIIPPSEITTFKNDKDSLIIDQDYATMDLPTVLEWFAKRKVATSIETIEEIEVNPENMTKERKRRGLTKSEAAKEIGISISTLSRYERNLIKDPVKDSLKKMKLWLNGGNKQAK